MSAWLAALALTLAITPAVIWAAHRWQLIDVPNHRSSHAAPVPRGGGVAVAVAVVASAVFWHTVGRDVALAAVGSVLLGAVGLADDRFHLPAAPRLAAQVAVPLVVSMLVVDGSARVAIGASAVAVVAAVGYVNAFNFMDGINGISASQAAIAAGTIAVLADGLDSLAIRDAALALCGASVGFLPFNAGRARIFLGDVGSYFIGAWLAGTALLVVDAGASVLTVLAPFLLYLADTSTVLIRRARRGAPLFEAHREHVYQRLHQLGWSHQAVSALCAAISAVSAVAMYATRDAGPSARALTFLACVAMVVGYLALPGLLSGRRQATT